MARFGRSASVHAQRPRCSRSSKGATRVPTNPSSRAGGATPQKRNRRLEPTFSNPGKPQLRERPELRPQPASPVGVALASSGLSPRRRKGPPVARRRRRPILSKHPARQFADEHVRGRRPPSQDGLAIPPKKPPDPAPHIQRRPKPPRPNQRRPTRGSTTIAENQPADHPRNKLLPATDPKPVTLTQHPKSNPDL